MDISPVARVMLDELGLAKHDLDSLRVIMKPFLQEAQSTRYDPDSYFRRENWLLRAENTW